MSWIDWVVLFVYAGGIVLLGWRASRGQKTADSHLRADRSLPAWAVVFSILATEVSAATYVAVPAAAFKSNWNYLQFAIGALLAKIVLSTWFIRLYWRLNLPTVYGFLAQRLGPVSQRTSAWAFLCGRLIASGVRLFIAAVAFAVVAGVPIEWAIIGMAVISTVYTFIGGLKAVVWTDVAQGSIFFIGAATAVAFGLWKLGLPFGQVLGEAWDAGKLQCLTFDDDGKGWFRSFRPLPVAVIGGFFLGLATHGTDQENVQHLLNTRSERASGRSIVVSGLFTFPIVAMFLSVGTVLWAYHQHVPPVGYALGTNEEKESVFPNFVITVLPAGLRGLVFAGLFAAAISSLAATLNAVTTAWMKDIRPRRQEGREGLRSARFLITFFGLVLMGVGFFFKWFTSGSQDDFVQHALGAMTILYGGILGTFLTALLMKTRGSDGSATAGLAAGVVCGAVLFFHVKLFDLKGPWLVWPWYIPISATVTLLVASLGRRRPGPTVGA